MAYLTDKQGYVVSASGTTQASQDHTSQKEMMDKAEMQFGSSSIPVSSGDPDALAKRMDIRREELNQVIEGFERNLSRAKSELRMVQAALDSHNADVPELARVSFHDGFNG